MRSRLVIPPRQNAVGEDQQIRTDRLGTDRLSSELQDAPYLARAREIGEGAQIDLSFRLCVSSPAPRFSPPPRHGATSTPVQVVKFELGLGRRVRPHGRLPADEIGKQTAGSQVTGASSRHAISAGAGEQHRRLAGTIGTGQYGNGVVERKPEVPDATQVPYANLHQSLVALALAGAQRIPCFVQLRGNLRHACSWCEK